MFHSQKKTAHTTTYEHVTFHTIDTNSSTHLHTNNLCVVFHLWIEEARIKKENVCVFFFIFIDCLNVGPIVSIRFSS